MKKLRFFIILAAFITVYACTSSQFATYRAAGSNDPAWQINVFHSAGVTDNFKVVINDSTVIDETVNFLSGDGQASGKYKNKDVKLTVNHSSNLLGDKFTAFVFINNELAAKFDF